MLAQKALRSSGAQRRELSPSWQSSFIGPASTATMGWPQAIASKMAILWTSVVLAVAYREPTR